MCRNSNEMKTAPGLLNRETEYSLPNQLFVDLQLNRILSSSDLKVLQAPCGKSEILRRQELFLALKKDDCRTKINNCLSLLTTYQRTLVAWRDAKIPLDRYHLHLSVLREYANICASLAALSDCGELCRDVADYYSDNERQKTTAEIFNDEIYIKKLLQRLHRGLLSFSDKNWIAPADSSCDEFDEIASCAKNLGFDAPKKKKHTVRIDSSLSDALCRLYAFEVAEIERVFKKYEAVDLYEVLAYIPEFSFFTHIHDLAEKARQMNIACCFPKISDKCQYAANAVYDISLLAKNCDRIIPNDVVFSEEEPFFFLIGANGGGKTTYLRALGINLVLFLSGCPVFAKEATIYPFDLVVSHFPADERFCNIGRLDEEVRRTEELLSLTSGQKAFFLFNETFSGTDEKRGFDLLSSTANKIIELGHFCLYVTHFHEVMNTDLSILSAEVDTKEDNKRTYRIVKMKGNASSYAADILKKYRLDKESLSKRRCGHGN